jgi:hypothetical protein
MSKCIMIGCDLHQESTVLKIAEDRQVPTTRKWKSTAREGTGPICRNGPPGAWHKASQPHLPRPGWYALSVNHLYDRTGQYRHFLAHEPVATAGYSIYISSTTSRRT